MFRFYFFALFFLVGALLCPVWAQDEGTYDDDYLDFGDAGGLVITASRTPEPSAEVPAQVTVISAGDIAESGAVSITEVLEQVPGVRFSGAISGAGSDTISMRGFGENSFGRVLVLIDGNKINDPDMKAVNWNAIPLSDIERIEVMDGSAAVQYGNSAVGGVINIITKKGGERRTLIGVSGGSFFYNRESVSHFEPVPWGNFSLSAEYTGTEGYRERQASRTANITAGANLFLRENLNLSLNAFFSDLYFQLPGGLDKEHFKDDPTKALRDDGATWPDPNYVPNFDDENTEYHFGGGVGLQWFPAKNAELNLPLSYRGKLTRMDMASFYNADLMTLGSYTDRTLHTVEARPQGSVTFSPADMDLRILGGVDVYFVNLDAVSFGKVDHSGASSSYTISEWTIGPYLTARFSPLSNLSLSAGVRFDTAIIDASKPRNHIDENKSYTAFVYEGGLVFNPLKELKLYAKYSSLFRYPFVDELAQVSGYMDKFNAKLKPETGFNAEAGVAYKPGKILDINANFFFMGLKDEISYNNDTNANENLDKTRRLGTNVGLNFTPADLLSFGVSYSFVDAVFTAGDNKDKHVPLVPAHKINGSLTVRLPFGLDFGPNCEYTSASYYGQDYANKADMLEQWFLLGASARYTLKKEGREFALQINAKNLLNTRYASYGTAFFDEYIPTPAWEYTLYPADGRSINISLQYRF